MNKILKISLAVVITSLSSCTTFQKDYYPSSGSLEKLTTQVKIKKHKNYASKDTRVYMCDDGIKFSLSFTQNKTAVLHLTNNTSEILYDHQIGDGIEYGNNSYVFTQHGQHEIEFIHNENTTTCKLLTPPH